MVKKFFKDSAVYGIVGIFSRGINLILLPVFTRVFSPEEYGIIDYVNIFGMFISITITLEIAQGVARFFHESRDIREMQTFASTGFWFNVFIFLVFTIVSMLFSTKLSFLLLGKPNLETIFCFSAINISLNTLNHFLQNQLRWSLRPIRFAISGLVYMTLSTTFSIVFVVIMHKGLIGYFMGYSIGSFAGCIVSIIFGLDFYRFRFSIHKCKNLLAFSLPLVPSSVGIIVAQYVDRIIIKQLMTMTDLGIYGIGNRFASIAGLIISGFQIALTPLIYKEYLNSYAPFKFSRIFRYYMFIILPSLFTISILSKDLISKLTPPIYHSSWRIIPLLAFSIVIVNMCSFLPGIIIAKKTWIIAIISIIGAALNTAGNLLLIPHLGIMGSAISNLSSSALILFLTAHISNKYYPIPLPWKNTFMSIILLASLYLFYLNINNTALFSAFSAPHLFLQIAFLASGIFGSSLLLLGKNEILFLLKKVKSYL